jgi:tight adherence protein C
MTPQRWLFVRLLIAGIVFLACFFLAYAAAAAPVIEGRRLGLRGLKRNRALQNVPGWESLEPVVRWLGGRVAGMISRNRWDSINAQIALAGDYMGLLPEELIGLSLLSFLFGAAAGLLFSWLTGIGLILVLAGAAVGAFMPHLQVSGTGHDRMKDISRRLPYAIDLLALSMGAGLDFPCAVRQVVDKSGAPEQPIIEEFTLILQSLQLGRTRRQALEEFAGRAPVNAVVEFVGAVVQAELRGNPLADVLRIQAEISRRKRSVRAEESAAKAGVAMIAPLVLVFVAILILIVAPIAMRVQASGL